MASFLSSHERTVTGFTTKLCVLTTLPGVVVVLGVLQKLDPTKPWYVNLTAISRAGLGNLV